MKRLLLFAPLIVFVLLAVFFYAALEMRKTRSVEELDSALIGEAFPEFAAVDLDGGSVSRDDLVTGQVTLVNVWGSWCPSCVHEHPYLKSLVEKGVRLVGIDYKDTPEEARNWLNRFGDIYEFHIQDPLGRLGIDLGVYGAPETFIVDGDGVIRFKRVGIVDERVWSTQMLPVYQQYGGQIDEG